MSDNKSTDKIQKNIVIVLFLAITFPLIVGSLIFGGVEIHKIKNCVMKVEKMGNDDTHYNLDSINNRLDSLPNISVGNLSKEIYSAAHDASESFVNQTGNLLSIFGIMLTIITAIICIFFPIMINKEYKELAEKRIKEYKDSIEKEFKEYKDSVEKALITSEQSIKEQQNTIDIIQTDIKNDYIRRKEQMKKMETHFKSTNIFAFNMRQGLIKTTNDILSKIKHYDEFKKLGDYHEDKEIINKIEKMIEQGISNSDIYYKLGGLYSKAPNTYDLACVAFKNAVNKNPEFVEAYLEWANVLEMQENWKDSWEKREKAIRLMNITKEQSEPNKSNLQELQNKQKEIELKILSIGPSDLKEKKTISIKDVAFNMILVKGGTFELGETLKREKSELQPFLKHKVLLDSYYMGETVVTQKLWNAFMDGNPSKNKGGDLPVENVSWNDAIDFIERLNEYPEIKKQEITFRLPTSAEWEYASRGGHEYARDMYLYSGENNIDAVAWYEKNSELKTHPVKKKDPNQLGLYDMSGNVFEWCQDFWKGFVHYYDDDDTWVNPCCDNDGYDLGRICRGGGWGSSEASCRVTSVVNGHESSAIGFRLVAQAVSTQQQEQ